MKPNVEKKLARATKAELTGALLSACQELAEQLSGYDMYIGDKLGYVAAGSLNNQVLKHLGFPDTIIEG